MSELSFKTLEIGRRFRTDRRASTAVEFALIAVPFLGLLLATFQTGFIFWGNEGLETAVQDAARNLMTGNAQGANVYDASTFKSKYLCPATGVRMLPSFFNCNNLVIDVRTASTFASADTTTDVYFNQTSLMFCPGGPSEKVIVRVAYPMPVLVPILVGNNNSSIQALKTGQINNSQLLLGTAVFQNEPYPAANYTKPSGC